MTNKEIIEQMYVDFGNGNIPGILDVLHDDIIFDTPGPEIMPGAGISKGKTGVADFFGKVGSTTAYQRFEPQDFIVEGDKVVATGSADFTITSTGKKGTSSWIMVWTFKNGKPVHVKNLWDTNSIAEAVK